VTYRLFVFDISKQSEVIDHGIANVRLELNFNSAVPGTAEVQVDLYCVSFYTIEFGNLNQMAPNSSLLSETV